MFENTCEQNKDLITNFDKEEEPIFREAIKQSGNYTLFITKEAYWMNGVIDDSMMALRTTNKKQDLSEFWKIYNLIKLKKGLIQTEV